MRTLAVTLLTSCTPSIPPSGARESAPTPGPEQDATEALASVPDVDAEPSEPSAHEHGKHSEFAPARWRSIAKLECPDDDACIKDGWMGKTAWTHGWLVDAEKATESINYVASQEQLTRVKLHCGLMGRYYDLFGVASVSGIERSLATTAERPGKPPKATTIRKANAYLEKALGYPKDSPDWENENVAERHVGLTPGAALGSPAAAFFSGTRTNGELVAAWVIYSPDSADVFTVLRRSRDQSEAGRLELFRRSEDDLVRLVSSLGLSRLRFRIDTGCMIPEVFGGEEWLLLQLPLPARSSDEEIAAALEQFRGH